MLRLVAMLMVVMLHILDKGGLLTGYGGFSLGHQLVWEMEALCSVSVNCFALITGYVMINTSAKVSRSLTLIVQVLFYSILSLIVYVLVFHGAISKQDLLFSVFPVTSGAYWYASAYFFLLFLIPVYNIFIHRLEKKELQRIIFLLILAFSVMPSVFLWSRSVIGGGNDVVWLSVLYFIGAYMRKYGFNLNKRRSLVFFFVFSSLSYALKICTITGTYILTGNGFGGSLFYSYNAFNILLASVCLFNYFRLMDVKSIFLTRISGLGVYSFGIYLCHEHPLFQKIIWDIFNISEQIEFGILATWGNIFIILLSIFCVGLILEKFRVTVMDTIKWNCLCEKVDAKLAHHSASGV